jgi:hypothetical protein
MKQHLRREKTKPEKTKPMAVENVAIRLFHFSLKHLIGNIKIL